jgi:hypothetical protein
MKSIFLEVTRSAAVLDQTFSEQFGQPVNQTAAPRFPPRRDARPPPAQARPRASSSHGAAFEGQGPGTNRGESDQERRRKRQRTPSQPPNPPQVQARPPPASSLASDIPRCDDHGLPCAEREVNREGPNRGRMFYACPLPQSEQCNFFAWVSESNGGPVVKCPGHDEPCVERTTRKEGPNKGRQFYACPRGVNDNNCGFFQWKDDGAVETSAATTTASTSRATAGGGAGDDGTPVCECDLPAVLLTCRNGANKGRTFHKCPKPQGDQCGFFQWG